MEKFVTLLLAAMPALAGTVTSAEINGFGSTTISGSAYAFYTDSNLLSPPDPSSIGANAQAFASTLGPVRNGFIEVTGWGGGEDPGSAAASIGDYTFGCGFLCLPSLGGTAMPFTLGIPFEVDVRAFAGILGQGAMLGSGAISFQFSLFESYTPAPGLHAIPGASVVIFDPPPPVPEPSTFATVGVVLLWLAALKLRTVATPHH